jgi:hypothetical protein
MTMTVMKLKINMSNLFSRCVFGIIRSTVSRLFFKTIDVIYKKIKIKKTYEVDREKHLEI